MINALLVPADDKCRWLTMVAVPGHNDHVVIGDERWLIVQVKWRRLDELESFAGGPKRIYGGHFVPTLIVQEVT